jgi:hypothetical protein
MNEIAIDAMPNDPMLSITPTSRAVSIFLLLDVSLGQANMFTSLRRLTTAQL